MFSKSLSVKKEAGKEALKVQKRIQGFDYETCTAWKKIISCFSPSITHNELLSIAVLFGQIKSIPIPRICRRSKVALVQWFQENYEKISDLFQYTHLIDSDFQPVSKN